MSRARIAWIAVTVLAAILLAIYFINPFGTASVDPRARIAGYATYRMPARSMEPTIPQGTVFMVDTTALRNRDPRVGEIIVFEYPRRPEIHYVNRVVATGGSTIEIRAGVVWLDGKPLDEPYLPREPATEISIEGSRVPLRRESTHTDMPATRVPENHFFVLGDFRGNSEDSRVWGFVRRDQVIGVYSGQL